MSKLIVFNTVTVDGYFAGVDGHISWAHRNKDDAEWNGFVAGNAKGGGILLFGRVTYQLMASFWPTPQAAATLPEVADRMNKAQKVVFSRTLYDVSWSNTRLVKDDLIAEVKKMKEQPGEGIAVLGSGSIVSQLTQAGLVDEFQIVVSPVVIGKGRTMFAGVDHEVNLKLKKTRPFSNGNVVHYYEPAA
jgi:dihydrofolate reductase